MHELYIDYEVLNSEHLYPVSYELERTSYTRAMIRYINKIHDIVKNIISINAPEYIFYGELAILSLCIKHKSCEHENEFRMICSEENEKEVKPIGEN